MIRLSMAERPSMRGVLKTLRLSHATLPSFFKNKPSPKTGYSESGTAAGGRNSYIELTSMGYRSELGCFVRISRSGLPAGCGERGFAAFFSEIQRERRVGRCAGN